MEPRCCQCVPAAGGETDRQELKLVPFDAVTRTLFEDILRDADAHVDWLEEQLDQIAQMGAAVYLSTQTRQ
jgi:bacterioferritin (cytochrome b1)